MNTNKNLLSLKIFFTASLLSLCALAPRAYADSLVDCRVTQALPATTYIGASYDLAIDCTNNATDNFPDFHLQALNSSADMTVKQACVFTKENDNYGNCQWQGEYAPKHAGTPIFSYKIYLNANDALTNPVTFSTTTIADDGSLNWVTPLPGPQQLVFGNTLTLSYQLSNTRHSELAINSVQLSVGHDMTLNNSCGNTLAAESTCTLQLTIQPSSVESLNDLLTVSATVDKQAVILTAPVNVNVVDSGVVYFSQQPPARLTIDVGATQNLDYIISNPRYSAVQLDDQNSFPAWITRDNSVANNCGTNLAGSSSCTVRLNLAPQVIQSFTLNFSLGITNDDNATQTLTAAPVAIQVVQSPTQLALSSPIPIWHDLLVGQSETVQYTLTNTSQLNSGTYQIAGFAPANSNFLSRTGSANDSCAASDTTGTLTPAASCVIEVQINAPANPVQITDQLMVQNVAALQAINVTVKQFVWANVGGGPWGGGPNSYGISASQDPNTQQTVIYLSTFRGVYRSDNNGQSWERMMTTAVPYKNQAPTFRSFVNDPATGIAYGVPIYNGSGGVSGGLYSSANNWQAPIVAGSFEQIFLNQQQRALYLLAAGPYNNFSGSGITVYHLDTGTTENLSLSITFNNNLTYYPTSIAFDESQNLAYISFGRWYLFSYDFTTQALTPIVGKSLLDRFLGGFYYLTFNPQDQRLYIQNGDGNIQYYDPQTQTRNNIATFSSALQLGGAGPILIDPSSGILYAHEYNSSSGYLVYTSANQWAAPINSVGQYFLGVSLFSSTLYAADVMRGPYIYAQGQWQSIAGPGLLMPTAFVKMVNGTLFAANNADNPAHIYSYNASNWQMVAAMPSLVNGLAVSSANKLYVATGQGVYSSANWNQVLWSIPTGALAIDNAGQQIYAGSNNQSGLWTAALNDDKNWQQVVTGTPLDTAIVTAIAIDSSTQPATIYAAAVVYSPQTSGTLYTNQGGTWHTISISGNPTFNSLKVDTKTTPATLYAATSQGLYSSANNWALLGLANQNLNDVAVFHPDAQKPPVLYASTNHGLSISLDGSQTWLAQTIAYNFNQIRGLDLDAQGNLYAGTSLEGAIQIQLVGPDETPSVIAKPQVAPASAPAPAKKDGNFFTQLWKRLT